jgi:hypothetical protein
MSPGFIPELYAYCAKHYDTFGPMALATNLSKWRAQRTLAPDDTVPAVQTTTTAQQRAEESMYAASKRTPS